MTFEEFHDWLKTSRRNRREAIETAVFIAAVIASLGMIALGGLHGYVPQ